MGNLNTHSQHLLFITQATLISSLDSYSFLKVSATKSTKIQQLIVTPGNDPTDGDTSMSLNLPFDLVSETMIYRSTMK